MTDRPGITITPPSGRIDERVHIRVVGLRAYEHITLRAEQHDDRGKRWHAHAEFQADGAGVVDVDAQQPLAGTYDSIDGIGLFWSMALDPADTDIQPFRKSRLTPAVIRFHVDSAGHEVAATAIERWILAPDIDRISVRAH